MADVRRSVNSSFWSDEWIESLSVEEKLFFLYLLTNDKTKISGFYQTTLKRMSFETGLTIDKIKAILNKFDLDEKVYFQDGYVQILNFLKNQKLNQNMKTSVLNDYKTMPKTLKGFEIISNHLKSFQSLRKREREREREREIESEIESEVEDEVARVNDLLNSQPDQAQPNQERDFFLWNYMQEEILKLLQPGEKIHEIKAPEKFDHYWNYIKKNNYKNPEAAIKKWINKDIKDLIEVSNE